MHQHGKQHINTWLILTVILFSSACAVINERTEEQIKPDDQLNGMLVTTGKAEGTTIFDYCDPFTKGPGVYERECSVPSIPNLKIGWGWFADTENELDSSWATLGWEMSLDGWQIDLAAFGTRDRRIFLEGSWVILREWNVILAKPTPGEHTLHYIIRHSQTGTEDTITDMTYNVTVTEK